MVGRQSSCTVLTGLLNSCVMPTRLAVSVLDDQIDAASKSTNELYFAGRERSIVRQKPPQSRSQTFQNIERRRIFSRDEHLGGVASPAFV